MLLLNLWFFKVYIEGGKYNYIMLYMQMNMYIYNYKKLVVRLLWLNNMIQFDSCRVLYEEIFGFNKKVNRNYIFEFYLYLNCIYVSLFVSMYS